jgi:hypothetical protein
VVVQGGGPSLRKGQGGRLAAAASL